MRANDHTDRMIAWWHDVGIDRVDLAVRRPAALPDKDGHVWLWQRAVHLVELPRLLPWTRAENARRADVYVRPARGSSWPVVFLDDLALAHALDLVTRHPGLCIHTSPEGGCQVWLRCEQLLDEEGRYRLQRHLADRLRADPGSVSGEHLGRLAGYRNWKRQGPWVNVLAETLGGPPLSVTKILESADPARSSQRSGPPAPPAGPDTSESAREWGWALGALQAGLDSEVVYNRLLARARPRRGTDAERYARHTLQRALRHLSNL